MKPIVLNYDNSNYSPEVVPDPDTHYSILAEISHSEFKPVDRRTIVDETIELHDVVSVSAGTRGLQILLAPADYLNVVKAILGPITRT